MNDKLKAILAREWDVSPLEIPDTAALNQFEKWDSLGHIKIMLALEEELDLVLDPDVVQSLSSLPKIVAHLEGLAAHV